MSKQGGKSQYQKKLARKKGRANPDPRWMWWFERGAKKTSPLPGAAT